MRAVAELAVSQLPEIPGKRYFAIGEVAELCAVKPHVLRYWEQEFAQLKPSKRRGNRRYYQYSDVQMVRRIRSLLYEQGFTIGGARQQLKDTSNAAIESAAIAPTSTTQSSQTKVNQKQRALTEIRDELEALLKRWPY
jgi:DNA-binding transcriptional MerR regulator